MKGTKKRDFSSQWERFYPAIFTLISTAILIFVLGANPNMNVEKVVDASINLSSILIGLLGALLGILISIRDTSVVNFLFSSENEKEKIFGFIKQAIFLGFLTIVTASFLYVNLKPVTQASYCFFNIWLLVTVGFLFYSYRILDILMYVLQVKDYRLGQPEPVKMKEDEADDLKTQLSRSAQQQQQ
jgi:hypothetical protein